MIILHNEHDEDSRNFVLNARLLYAQGILPDLTIIDWHGLGEEEKFSYVRAGLSPSAFPSVIADAGERQIPRTHLDENGGEVAALDKDGNPIMDIIPAGLQVVRKPATVAAAVSAVSALGKLATPEKVAAKIPAKSMEAIR